MPLKEITMVRPADMHCHFRQGDILRTVVPATARHYGIAVAMPNLEVPITTIKQAGDYWSEIMRTRSDWVSFRPVITAYVCEKLDPDELRRGFKENVWHAAKLYPQGATTNSDDAAASLEAVYPIFEVMQDIGMPLLLHGEVVGPQFFEYSRWEREPEFSRQVLPGLRARFPRLKMSCEHVSTRALVEQIQADMSGLTAGSITPHHAALIDGDVSRKGLWVDANCQPIIKGPLDRRALQGALTSGDSRFFAGTDSAPHEVGNKYARCCSFGAFVAPGSLEVYAAVFASCGALETKADAARFERFMSLNGPEFYGIPPARGKITLGPNTDGYRVTERFSYPGKGILEMNHIVPLFHQELGLAPDFPYVVTRYT